MMDLHCHIDLYKDPAGVIQRAFEKNMYVLSLTTTPSAWPGTYALTKNIPRFNTALGLHPQLAHLREHELTLFDKLINETRYIGEIGLDASKNFKPHLDAQLRVFRHILKQSEKTGSKILTIHTLNSVSIVLDELHAHPNCGKPILHWFLGTKTEMSRAIGIGCWFSIGPAMTTSNRGMKVIEWLPKDKILLETDGPFAKYNKKPLEPCDTTIVIQYLAKQWSVSEAVVSQQLKDNLTNLVTV